VNHTLLIDQKESNTQIRLPISIEDISRIWK